MAAAADAAMLAGDKEVAMSIVKTLRFPARVEWRGGRRVELAAPGKPPLDLATPPEFKDGVPGFWSPEELLVGAVAACYELTLAAIAARFDVPIARVAVEAAGHVDRGKHGYDFSLVELDVELEVEAEHEAAALRAAELAERHCIVGRALEVPVPVHVRVAAAPPQPLAVAS